MANTRISFSKPKSRSSGQTTRADHENARGTGCGARGLPSDHALQRTAKLRTLSATVRGTVVPNPSCDANSHANEAQYLALCRKFGCATNPTFARNVHQ